MDPLDELQRLHQAVDIMASRAAQAAGPRIRCARGCHGCCLDGLRVSAIEARLIVEHHGALLEQGEPRPPGACAFLDGEGACRIYAQRPYVCRTQGLPLRWFETTEADGAVIEHRDICPLNDIEGDPPIETLPQEACWTIGVVEARLAEIDARAGGGERVALRDLFGSRSA